MNLITSEAQGSFFSENSLAACIEWLWLVYIFNSWCHSWCISIISLVV